MGYPINPYVAGAPLRGERGFFGRQDTLDWVARELRNPMTNVLVLYGQRRIGKTTLLLQLRRTLPAANFLPIYFDLQDMATAALYEVLANLAETAADLVNLEPPRPEDFATQGHFFRRDFLPRLYQALGDKRRPVFLLDEFDVMDPATATELSQAAAANALFPFLRQVMNEEPRLAFVFVVGRRAEDFSLDFGATFKASLVHEIWVLDRSSAKALVRQAEANGTLCFTDEAVARILSLTSCHPYLTQLLCQRIWERAYADNPTATPRVDVSEVESAVPDALEAGDQALAWLWSGLSPAEKIYAAALAETAGEGEAIPEDRVIQVLTAHAARLRSREVELAPQDLVKRRVLEQVGSQEYYFAVELFRCWVRKNRRLGEVKSELDRMEPFADRLYEIGKEYFNRRQWEDTIRLFRDALEKNSRHFRARLCLGEALLELGRTDEAVDELEQAYELDRDEAHYALVRALVAQAQVREEVGDDEGALDIYKQVQQISPNERIAHDRRAAIWKRRGDAALKRNDFAAALAAYRETGDAKKVIQQVLDALDTEAQTHERAEQWVEAIAVLERIVQIDETYRNAYARLDQARANYRQQQELAELKPAELYNRGVELLHRQSWKESADAFAELIRVDPGYKDAWQKLGEATSEARKFEDFGRLYHAGRALLEKKQWGTAVSYLKPIVESGEQYKDASALLGEAREQLRRQTMYEIAEVQLEENKWAEAVKTLEEIVLIDPTDKEAKAKLDQAREQHRLQSLYEEALGHLRKERWTQAIRVLETIPNYRDAADRLKEAQEQQRLATLYIDAVGAQETGRWGEAIDRFRDIIRVAGVYRDVVHRLGQVQGQRDQELIVRFNRGEKYLRQRKWKKAAVEFERVYALDPDYRSVRARLQEVSVHLHPEELRKRGEASFRVGNWRAAVEIFDELRKLDPADDSTIMKLDEAKRQLELDRLYREGVEYARKGRWRKAGVAFAGAVSLDRDYRDAAAKLEIVRERSRQSNPVTEALRDPIWQGIGLLVAIVALIVTSSPFVRDALVNPATPTPKPLTLCNGTFDNGFECWQRGGELRQSVQCEAGQCYAVLGSPDYKCGGGVPVGEAWIKQSFQVPQTISPALSLRYRIFSYDLVSVDFLEVIINAKSVGQFGNTEWYQSSCDGVAWDSGWQDREFDLSSYRGEMIEVYLRNVNGKPDKWWNTWTYVDDVEVR